MGFRKYFFQYMRITYYVDLGGS